MVEPLRDRLNSLSYFPADVTNPIFQKNAHSKELNCTEIVVNLFLWEEPRAQDNDIAMLQAIRVVCESFPKLRKLSIFTPATGYKIQLRVMVNFP